MQTMRVQFQDRQRAERARDELARSGYFVDFERPGNSSAVADKLCAACLVVTDYDPPSEDMEVDIARVLARIS